MQEEAHLTVAYPNGELTVVDCKYFDAQGLTIAGIRAASAVASGVAPLPPLPYHGQAEEPTRRYRSPRRMNDEEVLDTVWAACKNVSRRTPPPFAACRVSDELRQMQRDWSLKGTGFKSFIITMQALEKRGRVSLRKDRFTWICEAVHLDRTRRKDHGKDNETTGQDYGDGDVKEATHDTGGKGMTIERGNGGQQTTGADASTEVETENPSPDPGAGGGCNADDTALPASATENAGDANDVDMGSDIGKLTEESIKREVKVEAKTESILIPKASRNVVSEKPADPTALSGEVMAASGEAPVARGQKVGLSPTGADADKLV